MFYTFLIFPFIDYTNEKVLMQTLAAVFISFLLPLNRTFSNKKESYLPR